MKTCTKCNKPKRLTSFYIRSNGKPHAWCKPCYKQQVRDRRNGPERANVLRLNRRSQRKRNAQIRDEAFAAYGGYRCVCCGETEPLFLSLDHIENDGGEFRKNELGVRTAAGVHTYRWLKRNGWPPAVQVLCMNCQHGKRMNKGTCPHGNV